jgi:hypothetical protein
MQQIEFLCNIPNASITRESTNMTKSYKWTVEWANTTHVHTYECGATTLTSQPSAQTYYVCRWSSSLEINFPASGHSFSSTGGFTWLGTNPKTATATTGTGPDTITITREAGGTHTLTIVVDPTGSCEEEGDDIAPPPPPPKGNKNK